MRRFLAAGLSATAIGLYTILVSADAAVVRAAPMGALWSPAGQCPAAGKPRHGRFQPAQLAASLGTAVGAAQRGVKRVPRPPALEVLQAVQGYNLLHTDQNGWVHLSTDGGQLWAEAERRQKDLDGYQLIRHNTCETAAGHPVSLIEGMFI